MGTIIYKPHCSKCGAVINEKVEYMNIVFEPQNIADMAQQTISIFPWRCEHCGQPFTKIEIPMPEQLPTERIK